MTTSTPSARLRTKPSRGLAPRHAVRIRYGILAAREDFESRRLTPSQMAFLDECRHGAALMLGDTGTQKPYDREIAGIRNRLSTGVK